MKWNCAWKNCKRILVDDANKSQFPKDAIFKLGYSNVSTPTFVHQLLPGNIGYTSALVNADYGTEVHQIKIELKATNISIKVDDESATPTSGVSAIVNNTKGLRIRSFGKTAPDITISLKITDLTLNKVLSGNFDIDMEDLDFNATSGANIDWEGVKPSSNVAFDSVNFNGVVDPTGVGFRIEQGFYGGYNAPGDTLTTILRFKVNLKNDWTELFDYRLRTGDTGTRDAFVEFEKINFNEFGSYVNECSQNILVTPEVKNCSVCSYVKDISNSFNVTRYQYELVAGGFVVSKWYQSKMRMDYVEGLMIFNEEEELISTPLKTKYPYVYVEQERKDCENLIIRFKTCVDKSCCKNNCNYGEQVKNHFLQYKDNCKNDIKFNSCGLPIEENKSCWKEITTNRFKFNCCSCLNFCKPELLSSVGNDCYMSKFAIYHTIKKEFGEHSNEIITKFLNTKFGVVRNCNDDELLDMKNKSLKEIILENKTKIKNKVDKCDVWDFINYQLTLNQIKGV